MKIEYNILSSSEFEENNVSIDLKKKKKTIVSILKNL